MAFITRKQLLSPLLSNLQSDLSECGFKKNVIHQHLYRNTDYGRFSLHLMLASNMRDISVEPNIGIRLDDLEELIYDNTEGYYIGEGGEKGTFSTGIFLNRIMPSPDISDKWRLSDLAGVGDLSKSIAQQFVSYGLPFIERYSNKEILYQELKGSGGDRLNPIPLKKAINILGLNYLLGDTDEFPHLFNDLRKWLENIPTSQVEFLIDFARNLEHRLRTK